MNALPRMLPGTLPTYLWKEWRDHRAVIVAYLIAAPLLIALGATCTPDSSWVTGRNGPTIGALVGFCIAALAFGSDLVSGELRRGKLGFLARMPSDLGGAFTAKLAFLAAALLGFAGWTWLCVAAAGAIGNDRPWCLPVWRDDDTRVAWLAAVGASWLFAVSCWMPRGTFVLPATALALAAWIAPVISAFKFNHGMRLRDGEIANAAAWLAASGIGVAALSFVRGWRHGGPLRPRLGWSLVPALLAIAPVWGWAGLRVREHRHLDPSEPSFRLHATALGMGGRFAFVNGFHQIAPVRSASQREELGALHPMIVDVATGAWREAGDPGDLFWHLGHLWDRASARSLLLVEDNFEHSVPMASQFVDGFDGATGATLTSEQWKPLLKGARGRVFRHESGCTVLPTGERAWVADGAIVVEGADGTLRPVPESTVRRWERPLGHGFVGGGAEEEYFDCTRGRSWHAHDVDCEVKLIRAGGWVVMRALPGSQTQISLWDPETDRFSLPDGLGSDEVTALHPDGRLFVLRPVRDPDERASGSETANGSFSLLDLERGLRTELPLPPLLAENVMQCSFDGFTASGDLLFLFQDRRASGDDATRRFPEWIARFDPQRDELTVLGPFGRCFPNVLGSPDHDTVVFVEDDRRLVRAHFDGRPTEILFPR